MCTLAVYFRASRRYPLLLAANRDEFLARPTREPAVLDERPWIVAGLDLEAGGTWLGLHASGLVAAILNRRTSGGPDPTLRSRGLLCLEALRQGSVERALAFLRAQDPSRYNPFHLLLADGARAVLVRNRQAGFEERELRAGLHLVSNLDLDDPTCPRIAGSYLSFAFLCPLLDRLAPREVVSRLRQVLSRHETPLDPRDPETSGSLCVHRGPYGTRSSTVVLREGPTVRYFHASGPPCRSSFAEVPVPADSPP
ncbi:MAG: hypothetical protein KatS3mg076_0426 [Candidatus Binatia bacterium]|nr:MAG: hypothetical protein KatS3mg076_0426 [Candidatus Binatia bacterium]